MTLRIFLFFFFFLHEQDCATQHGTTHPHCPRGIQVARLLGILVTHYEQCDVGIENIANYVQNGKQDGYDPICFREQDSR